MTVRIPESFTDAHKVIVRRFIQEDAFIQVEQALLFDAFDLLHQAQITIPSGWRSFATVYEQLIETRFANEYLHKLSQVQDVTGESEPLRAHVSSQIMPLLKKANLLTSADSLSFYLFAYCLYWWYVFAKGYAFEIAVFRDLTLSGVRYKAHDVLDPYERRSPHDLTVLGLRGDIKTSTYFLHSVRTANLSHDFYISRLYKSKGEQLIWTVFLQAQAWKAIQENDTLTGFITLDTLASLLPGVFQFQTRSITLTTLDYLGWKQRILKVQERPESA